VWTDIEKFCVFKRVNGKMLYFRVKRKGSWNYMPLSWYIQFLWNTRGKEDKECPKREIRKQKLQSKDGTRITRATIK